MKAKGLISKFFISTFVLCLIGIPANAQFGKLNKLKSALKNKVEKTKNKAEEIKKGDDNNNATISMDEPVGKFTRKKADIDKPEEFYSADYMAQEHAGWNKDTPTGKLQEHVTFLITQQIKYLNAGDWENVAADFKGGSKEMWKVYNELNRREVYVVWLAQRLYDLRQMQRQHLYPGIHVYDRTGHTTYYQTGDFGWKDAKINKKEFYEILNYYIEMAQREKSKSLKYVSTSQAIFWRGDGVMNPAAFGDNPIYGDDTAWIEADKKLSALCTEVGINGLVSFEKIDEYRKQLVLKELKEQMARNTNLIPKSSINDPQAIKMATESFNQMMNGKANAVKVFVKSGWEVTTNALGVKISRAKYMTIIAKHKDGIHRLHNCRLVSVTSNNGGSWSNSMFSIDSVKGNREGYPVNWK